jgi:hypothetical protein
MELGFIDLKLYNMMVNLKITILNDKGYKKYTDCSIIFNVNRFTTPEGIYNV